MNLSMVFMEVRKDPSFKRSPKMRTSLMMHNNQKYCEYHHDHGHWTDDSTNLRKEIEMFIRGGKLTKFLAKKEGREIHPWRSDRKEWSPVTTSLSLEFLKGSNSNNVDHHCVNLAIGYSDIEDSGPVV